MRTWTLKDEAQSLRYGWGIFFRRPHLEIQAYGLSDKFDSDVAARKHVLDFAFSPLAPLPEDIREEVLLCRKAITHIVLNK